MTSAELRLLDDYLARRRRVIEDYRGAAVALETAQTHPSAFKPEDVARREASFDAAHAAYDAEFGRKVELTAAEREALAWAERVSWLPWTRPKIAALCGALRRIGG